MRMVYAEIALEKKVD
jgi:hypothetical protein